VRGNTRTRLAGGAGAIAFAALLLVAAPPAGATTTTVQCSAGTPAGSPSLATTLSHVHSGDTVIIDGLCTGDFSLPSSSNAPGGYTIEGTPGTASGFDGQGTSQGGALLSGTVQSSSPSGAVTLSDLTFENAVSPGSGPSALELTLSEGALTLSGDTFTHNTNSNSNGDPPEIIFYTGAPSPPCTSQEASLAITNSTFSDDTYTVNDSNASGGAGLEIEPECAADPTTLTGNQFTGDTVVTAGSTIDGLGGGLLLFGPSTPAAVTQSANVFDSDKVSAATPGGDYGGAGEFTIGISLTSTRDRFTNDSLPGTTGPTKWAWGAGIGVLNSSCNSTTPTTSTLTDDVIASNTIIDSGSDLGADAQGAGAYVGVFCGPQASDNTLALVNSTVTANSVTPASSSAVAGIDGDTKDNLTLENTILDGDSGGAETGGFSLTGSSITATYSDFCAGAAPYAGTGNICAAPALGGTLGVQESASSPTIDKGSNALVPAGLTSDFFGAPRELDGTLINCTGVAGTVDIGAAEYAPACPATLTLTGAGETNTKWSEGSAAATVASAHHRHKKHHAKPPPVGTSFTFTLNAQADVSLTFTRLSTGRSVHGRCVATTKKNKHRRHCAIAADEGILTLLANPGTDTLNFDGVVFPGDSLPRGSYTVSLGAAVAGKTATPTTLSFTIVKP
jgi:hypothetical protein